MTALNLSTRVALCLISAITTASAQKLPNVQQVSVRAPTNIKIDGKLDDWGGKLQAYNRATEAYYTIANDDDNLYLVIHIDKTYIINKAISGSITLTINNSGKKNDENCPAISFPLLNIKSGSIIRSNLKKETQAVDSVVMASNNELANNAKEIKLSGINGITDTLTGTHTKNFEYFHSYPLFYLPGGYYINAHNNHGIKAATAFESKWGFTYELQVPLKYLNISRGKKFSYNIRLNGPMAKNGKLAAGYVMVRIHKDGVTTTQDQDMLYPTDVWGEYTLANKDL